ncbi:uncharacterized protein LOC115232460 [Argonauta hians]
MDNFFGTWKQEGKAENLGEVIDSLGGGKTFEAMINGSNQLTIGKCGDKYTLTQSILDLNLSKTFTFSLGEPVEDTDLFGRKFKAILKLENPNLLSEHVTLWSEDPFDCTFEIIGDTLEWKIKAKGHVSKMTAKKIA